MLHQPHHRQQGGPVALPHDPSLALAVPRRCYATMRMERWYETMRMEHDPASIVWLPVAAQAPAPLMNLVATMQAWRAPRRHARAETKEICVSACVRSSFFLDFWQSNPKKARGVNKGKSHPRRGGPPRPTPSALITRASETRIFPQNNKARSYVGGPIRVRGSATGENGSLPNSTALADASAWA